MPRGKKASTPKEIPLYDWVPGCRWTNLIYSGRKPSKEDPGIVRSQSQLGENDILFVLLKKKYLTGVALEDALAIYGEQTD